MITNPQVSRALTQQFENLVNGDPRLTQSEILAACLTVIGGTLAAIQCRDCRKLNAQITEKEFRREIAAALAKPGGPHLF